MKKKFTVGLRRFTSNLIAHRVRWLKIEKQGEEKKQTEIFSFVYSLGKEKKTVD